jgi:hypothetical protein
MTYISPYLDGKRGCGIYCEGWSGYISGWTLDQAEIYICGDSTRRPHMVGWMPGRAIDIYLGIVPGWWGSRPGG